MTKYEFTECPCCGWKPHNTDPNTDELTECEGCENTFYYIDVDED